MSAEFNFERAKYTNEQLRTEAHRAHDEENGLLRMLVETSTRDAQATVRLLFAVNGGVAAALLAFSGGLISREKVSVAAVAGVVENLKWFALGLLAAAVASMATYFTNGFYAGASKARIRNWLHPYVHQTSK